MLILGTGFTTHGFVRADGGGGPRRPDAREAWGGVPKAYLGITVPGFPNMFLLYGPNTNGGAGSVIYTVEAATQHVIAAIRELERANARTIELRPQAAAAFDRELRGRSRERSGTPAAPAGTWTSTGANPNQWPWVWSTYRRRTAKVDPAAYELA